MQGIVDKINKNSNLWNQRFKLEGFGVDDIEDFDEFEGDERDALENILADAREFKLFTTAKSMAEIQAEATDVKRNGSLK